MKTDSEKNDPSAPPEKTPAIPKEASGDAFPADEDVSAAPPGSDESDHEDKKE